MSDSVAATPDSPRSVTSSMRPHIVVGVDGSEASINALRQAAKLATAFGGSVEAVSVWEFPASVIGFFPPDWSPGDDAHTILSGAIATVFGETRPAWLEQTVIEGSPSRELLTLSKDADMLIVGGRGHGGFTGLRLGAVSSVCSEYSSCPTLVMHGDRLFSSGSGR